MKMNEESSVRMQYKDSGNLSRRLSLHQKYSINKTGMKQWLFEQFDIFPGSTVLELGCGTGDLWANRADILPSVELYLTDFSDGMVCEVSQKYSAHCTVHAQQADIQSLQFGDAYFDRVIANFMLYHVPDFDAAMREVRRVLKPGGIFYAATVGDHHLIEINHWMREYNSALDVFNSSALSFRMQNGEGLLKRYFKSVQSKEFVDGLAINDSDDLVDYLFSLEEMQHIGDGKKDDIKHFLQRKKDADGIFRVSKQSGLFIAS